MASNTCFVSSENTVKRETNSLLAGYSSKIIKTSMGVIRMTISFSKSPQSLRDTPRYLIIPIINCLGLEYNREDGKIGISSSPTPKLRRLGDNPARSFPRQAQPTSPSEFTRYVRIFAPVPQLP